MLPAADAFPKEEYLTRQEKVKGQMAGAELDALIISSEDNVYYLTGARIWELFHNYVRPFVLILPRDGEPELVLNQGWEESVKRIGSVKNFTTYARTKIPVEETLEVLKRKGLGSKRLGFELGLQARMTLPYGDYERLVKSLPNAPRDASSLLWNVRMVKSNLEIVRIRRACLILEQALRNCFEMARPGMSEREVIHILSSEIVRLGADKSGLVIMSSGPYNYQTFTGGPTENVLQEGNTVSIDSGAIYLAYRSEFARCASVGRPSDRQLATYKAVIDFNHLLVSSIKAGVRASDIMRLYRKESEIRGIVSPNAQSPGLVGHGIGLLIMEPPFLNDTDDTILKPGMTLGCSVGQRDDSGFFYSEENLVVTEDGSELLSNNLQLYEI